MPLVPHPAPPSQIHSERISKPMTFQILRVSEHRQTKPASTVKTTNEANNNNNNDDEDGQSSSHDGRFRFIRVDRSYTRGRWGCSDYADSQLNQQIYNFQERSNPRPNAPSIRCTHWNSGLYTIVGEPKHNTQEERSASSNKCCETEARTQNAEKPRTTHDVLSELTAHVVDGCRITSQDELCISLDNHPVDKCIQSESKEISDGMTENSDESVQTTASTVSESTRNTVFDMASFVANSDESKTPKNSNALHHERPFDLQIHELNGMPIPPRPHMCLSIAGSPESPVLNSSNLIHSPPSNIPLVLLPNTIKCDLDKFDEIDRMKIKRLVNEPADVAGQILKELGVNMAENIDPEQGAQSSNQENKTPSEIDNKIEAAMDLVKNHLMSAVREEVAELKLQIKELLEKNASLEKELSYIRCHVPAEILSKIDEKCTESNQPSVNPSFNQ